MIKALIFDLDGTLVNTLEDLRICTNEVLKEYNYGEIETDKFKYLVGNGIKKLIERAIIYSNGNLEYIDEIFEKFMRLYDEKCLVNSSLYNNVKLTLNYLKSKNLLLFVNTNKHHDIACKIINYLLPNYFAGIYGVQDLYPKKPNPFIVNKIINDYNLLKDEILYVGDSDVDILTAHNAGIKIIGCSYGFREKNELFDNGSDYIIDDIIEILEIINK